MKTVAITLAAALALAPLPAVSGGLAPAVEEPPVTILPAPEPQSSLGNLVVPALLLGLIALAASAESSSATVAGVVETKDK